MTLAERKSSEEKRREYLRNYGREWSRRKRGKIPPPATTPQAPALELIRMVAEGWSNRKIAQHLGIKEQWAKDKVTKAYRGLGMKESAEWNRRVLLAKWYWERTK